MIATQSTTLADTLATQFQMNHWIATRNLEGITQEESLVRAAADGGSHINWLVGHVTAVRCALLPALGQQSPWGENELRRYQHRTSAGPAAECLPFDEIVRTYLATQEPLLAGIAALTEEDLAKPAPFSPGGGPETLGGLLMKSTVHEGYHLGQTAILRRVVGKPGAIK